MGLPHPPLPEHQQSGGGQHHRDGAGAPWVSTGRPSRAPGTQAEADVSWKKGPEWTVEAEGRGGGWGLLCRVGWPMEMAALRLQHKMFSPLKRPP